MSDNSAVTALATAALAAAQRLSAHVGAEDTRAQEVQAQIARVRGMFDEYDRRIADLTKANQDFARAFEVEAAARQAEAARYEAEIARLQAAHSEALTGLQRETDRTIESIKQRAEDDVRHVTDQALSRITELEAEIAQATVEKTRLKDDLARLQAAMSVLVASVESASHVASREAKDVEILLRGLTPGGTVVDLAAHRPRVA